MKNQYKLNVGTRTNILNLFRRVFKLRPIEKILAKTIRLSNPDSLLVRFAPPNYIYPKNSRRRLVRNGIKYDLDLSDFMEHGVYFGPVEASQEKLFKLAENKEVIIDVGVNMGATLLNFAKVAPKGMVYGFEPDEKNFRKAQQNLALNGVRNATLIRKGLGDQERRSKLFKVNDDNEGMNRIFDESNDSFLESVQSEEIQVIRLDDFVQEQQLLKIDLIKIDVEGYELKVLKGAIGSIDKHHPTLFVEIDDKNLKAQNDSARLLIEFLEAAGYRLRSADDDRSVSSNTDFTNCHFDVIADAD